MSKRTYHSWTEEESARLYKFVLRCDRNWAEVQRQFVFDAATSEQILNNEKINAVKGAEK
ncbi:Homeobox-like_domain superfamily [Hexamita inflata]|uniref:Homeobox-like domain superfamily n=1 Tax=Hexamita inflata TaxID=28002 RepID=A0AA86Q6J6_9EUKA|nr:Homeobox-like domain superfamily [Hexamita inflata]